MTTWLEVVVPTTVTAADDVAAELIEVVAAASTGTQLRGDEVVFWVPVEDGEVVLDQVRETVRALAARGVPVDPDTVHAQPAAAEEEWRDAWKKYFHVTRLSRQIVVVPSWETYEPGADDIVIELDPGQAFGTGAHASTQLVLAALQEARDQGRKIARFVDVGCGSGILSIAACAFWPEASGVAIDIDPLAITATDENCENNGVAGRVVASTTAIGDVEGTFDLVLANIQAHILLALGREIADRVAPGGLLMLSGLLSTQAAEVARTYADTYGLEVLGLTTSTLDPEWTSATLARPSQA